MHQEAAHLKDADQSLNRGRSASFSLPLLPSLRGLADWDSSVSNVARSGYVTGSRSGSDSHNLAPSSLVCNNPHQTRTSSPVPSTLAGDRRGKLGGEPHQLGQRGVINRPPTHFPPATSSKELFRRQGSRGEPVCGMTRRSTSGREGRKLMRFESVVRACRNSFTAEVPELPDTSRGSVDTRQLPTTAAQFLQEAR